jgi:hypothetical protein
MDRTRAATLASGAGFAGVPTVLSFFIMYCEGKNRAARSLFQEEFARPAAGSRHVSLEDFQNVVRDLVVHQEIFDGMLRPVERPGNGAGLPPGRSFRCLRGATFALHQFVSGTGVRFFLMTDPAYPSADAQRKLAAIYAGPFVDLVCRGEGPSLRQLLDAQPVLVTAAAAAAAANAARGNGANDPASPLASTGADSPARPASDVADTAMRMLPVLPPAVQAALRLEVLSILRSG